MPDFKIPKYTGLNHAVRWIVTGQRFLSPTDGFALRDFPKVEEEEFRRAKEELLLALRQGLLRAQGNLEVFDSRFSVFEDCFLGDDEWDSFLGQYRERVAQADEGRIFVGHGIAIPSHLWQMDMVKWPGNCLHYNDGELQARFFTCLVSSEELLREFSRPEIALRPDDDVVLSPDPAPHEPQSSAQEKSSLLKLIAAMSVRGYKFNPNSQRNRATADIAEDLQFIGTPLDQKTILKWLREAAKLISPSYRFDDEAAD